MFHLLCIVFLILGRLLQSSCRIDGNVPADANPLRLADDKKGMTWVKLDHNDSLGIDRVGCNNGGDPAYGAGCDAYNGDTLCTEKRPLLCLKQSNATRPDYTYQNSQFYDGWSGGHISLTIPYAGTMLLSKANADYLCALSFGDGWKMAEFHDSETDGGWAFRAYGNIPFHEPAWVSINNQPANCW